MQRDDVALRKQWIECRRYNPRGGARGAVPCEHSHPEALRYLRDTRANLAKSDDADRLARKIEAEE